MNGARLYITCGLPFAGKTTLAREIAQRLGWAYLALDDINAARGIGLSGESISSLDWSRSYAEAHRRLAQALAEGNTVIYDATNFSRKERARLRTIAARHGAAVTVIYLRLAEGEAQRRWQANRSSGARYDVRDEDYALVESNFEPPLDNEDVLVYEGLQPAAEWITQALEGRIMADFTIRPLTETDGEQVRQFMVEHWGAEIVVGVEGIYHPHQLSGYVAETGGAWVGLVTYQILADNCEVVTLDSLKPGRGIGGALLEAVKQAAIEAGCTRLWLSTTNDNLTALRFYQKWGLTLAQLYPNVMVEWRKLKPQIPLRGKDGIPLRDALVLEMALPR